MSVQYTDNHFGENKSLNDAHDEFMTALQAGTAKALHVGSIDDLKKVRDDVDMSGRLNEIDKRLSDIEADNKPSLILKPTMSAMATILESSK